MVRVIKTKTRVTPIFFAVWFIACGLAFAQTFPLSDDDDDGGCPPDLELVCPDDITVECAGPDGTVVEFEVMTLRRLRSGEDDDDCDDDGGFSLADGGGGDGSDDDDGTDDDDDDDGGGGEVIIVCDPPSGSLFPIGTTEVCCVAMNGNGDILDTCCFFVTVEDTALPEITCPDDITVACEGSGGATVEFEATGSDLCTDVVTIDCIPPSGSLFPIGMTMVMCTATDGSGNTAECSFKITVTDNPPTIDCPDTEIIVECTNPNGEIVTFDVTATDDCTDVVTIECMPPSGSIFTLGTTTVTCTATDGSGNTDTCMFDVTVQDTTDPEITCPNDITLECTGPNGTQVDWEATATDLCGAVTVVCDPSPGLFPCGEFPVTCTATDAAGNTAECSFLITVEDTVAPDIECPEDIVVSGSDKPVTVDFEVVVSDLCDPDPTLSCNPPSGSVFNPGTTIVVCTAIDAKGNSSNCMFEVEVTMCVNFDEDVNGPISDFTFITNEYAPIGIQISGISDTGNAGVIARRTGPPGSTREDLIPTTGLNYAQTWSGGDDSDSGKIVISFFNPDTQAALTSSFVQVVFLDIESSGEGAGGAGRTRLKAFDAGGNLIDRVIVPFGTNANQFTATIGAPGGPLEIASAEMVIGNANDSGGIDEFCFLPNLSQITVGITGTPEVHAGESLIFEVFVRNNTDEDLNVSYKMRGTPKLNKPGRNIEGPDDIIMPAGFNSLANPASYTIPIRGDRNRFWNRDAYVIVTYEDTVTGEFIGMGQFKFRILPPRQ